MNASKYIAALGTTLLVSCGGSTSQMAGIDGGGAPPPVATVVSIGTITGFGSVIVNGVHYNTAAATITIDDLPGTESDLAVGQVVIIKGTLNSGGLTGVASSVTFNDVLEGPISAIDNIAETLIVLGQLVRVDAETSFDDGISPASLDGLSVGDIIEVSGFVLADGTVNATRIELGSPGGELEVKGIVSNLNATTFEINNLVVDYSSATLEDFPGGVIQNGQPVEVKGDFLNGSGELVATKVEFEGNQNFGDDGDRAEIEGFITRFASATDFDVEGLPVTTNGQTQFENGTSADLALNRKVEVEGDLNGAGILVAGEIEFKQTGSIRIESLVEAVQANQLTLLGIDVIVNSATRFEDQSSAKLQPFDLSDVNVGDYVEVRAFDDGQDIVATRLERDDFDSEVALRGIVDSVNDPEFVILGTTIQTDSGTEFRDANEQIISAATFFAQAVGETVEADGQLVNGAFVAEEVEFED